MTPSAPGQQPSSTAKVRSYDGVATATAGDVLFVLWQAPSRIARARWVVERLEEIIATHGNVVLVQLILPSSSPPDQETRAYATVTFRKLEKALRRLVSVPLGDAMWSQIVRTIMRAMMIVLGRAEHHAVVATPREAIDKVRAVAGPKTPSAADLHGAVADLYRALGVDYVAD